MIFWMRPLALIVALISVAGGCVKSRQYRTLYPPAPAPAPNAEDTRVLEEREGYKLAFIEFDERGELFDARQRQTAIQTIRKERGLDLETGAFQPGETVGGVTVIYIHGWKNNARSVAGRTKDVEKFRASLAQIQQELIPDVPGMRIPLTGVYIGWRGRSIDADNDFLNWWTIWPRSLAAGRVGSETLQKTLSQIIQAGVTGRARLGEARPRVILVGHSLGAKVLERATERPRGDLFDNDEELADRTQGLILGQCKVLQNGPTRAPLDLVVAVNEATRSGSVRRANRFCTPAADEKTFVRHPRYNEGFCAKNQNHARCRPYPLFVHVASSADWTTRWLFLFAFAGRTAPHSAELHTHRVEHHPDSAPAPEEAIFTFQTKRDGVRTYAVSNRSRGINRHPVWNMRVDKHVMRSHGDIWNADFTRMLLSMMGGLEALPLKSYRQETKRVAN